MSIIIVAVVFSPASSSTFEEFAVEAGRGIQQLSSGFVDQEEALGSAAATGATDEDAIAGIVNSGRYVDDDVDDEDIEGIVDVDEGC